MSSLFNYQSFACHRYIEQMLERFSYLTLSQLSTGLKDFWVNFFRKAKLKKNSQYFFCMLSCSKNVCLECH